MTQCVVSRIQEKERNIRLSIINCFFDSHFYVYPFVYWMNYTVVKQRNGLFYLTT